MNVLGLIAHASLLIHIGKDVEGIVKNLGSHQESFPSKAEFAELITDALELLSSGLVSLPPDVAQKIAASLSTLKAGLEVA